MNITEAIFELETVQQIAKDLSTFKYQIASRRMHNVSDNYGRQ
jgi:hypothetical protein